MKTWITGMGAISSLGLDVSSFFTGLLENRSGVQKMEGWDQQNGLHCHLGAPVAPYEIQQLPRTVRRSMSRMSEMATLATFQALDQAGLPRNGTLNSPRVLLIMGSTSGSPSTLEIYFKKLFERNGPEGQVSTSFFKVMNHSVAANVAAALDFQGALISPSSACATSTQAILMGWEFIQAGLYDVVIAGGADELHYMSAAIFDIVQAASRKYNHEPERASRPFDRARDGLIVSEGGAVVVLESDAHAARRGARPLAEVKGGAYLCDGSHMTQSSATTMAMVMRHALERSGLQPQDIDYLNAHATSTTHGDIEEARAIAEVFGTAVPVSSLKGHLGHSLAACGALEAIACIKMMEHEVLIPTRNLTEVDPECSHIQLIREIQRKPVRSVLSNNFAFGGMNTSLLLSNVNPQ